jgi:uncharacterized protein YecE (DUF72 family)
MPNILIGTSGFSYPEWKKVFYPEDLPAKQYLPFYAERFKTTEINNTFYRIPTLKLTQDWYQAVPKDFVFTLKLSQRITHQKRLKETDEEMDRFLEAAFELKGKLGTILVQLPPYFKRDDAVLKNFLQRNSKSARLAVEFRHDSWLNDEVYAILHEYGCALGVVEAEERAAVQKVTGPFCYMRLRKGDYTKDELAAWADWMRKQNSDVYCYLKHDERAPVLAQQLLDLMKS